MLGKNNVVLCVKTSCTLVANLVTNVAYLGYKGCPFCCCSCGYLCYHYYCGFLGYQGH